MTRPVYEPTPARYDAYNDFGNQQLFRRPAPETGAAPFPIFYAWQAANSTTFVSGNDTVILWDTWINSDTSVFDTQLSGSNLSVVELLQDGLYSLTMALVFTTNFNAAVELILAGSYDFNQSVINAGVAGGPGNAATVSWTLIYPPPHETPPAPGDPSGFAQWQARQDSGINRASDDDFTWMQIAYLGPVSASLSS